MTTKQIKSRIDDLIALAAGFEADVLDETDECAAPIDAETASKIVDDMETTAKALVEASEFVSKVLHRASKRLLGSSGDVYGSIDRGYDQFRLRDSANFVDLVKRCKNEDNIQKGTRAMECVLGTLGDMLPEGQEHRVFDVCLIQSMGWAVVTFVIPENPGIYIAFIPVPPINDALYPGGLKEEGTPGRMKTERRIVMRYSLSGSDGAWKGRGAAGFFSVSETRKYMETELRAQWDAAIAESARTDDAEAEMLEMHKRELGEKTYGLGWFAPFEDYPRRIDWNAVKAE